MSCSSSSPTASTSAANLSAWLANFVALARSSGETFFSSFLETELTALFTFFSALLTACCAWVVVAFLVVALAVFLGAVLVVRVVVFLGAEEAEFLF